MDYLALLKGFGADVKNYQETKNFYYENHNCSSTGNTKKVNLDYIISNETTDKVMRFGICEDCKTCFYHYDFISKSY